MRSSSSPTPRLNFQALFALSAASYNASELGEVLTTIDRIHAKGNSYAAFYEAFLERGEELRAGATTFRRAGHKVSAREAYAPSPYCSSQKAKESAVE